jgi:hypothetical protein
LDKNALSFRKWIRTIDRYRMNVKLCCRKKFLLHTGDKGSAGNV